MAERVFMRASGQCARARIVLKGGMYVHEKTSGRGLPDIENMASACEYTGSLPALPAEKEKPAGKRARLKARAAKKIR